MSEVRSKITGVGMYVPDNLVKNADLTKWMDTSDEWIQQRTGIKSRYWAPFNEKVGCSDFAVHAAKDALKKAGVDKSEIDMIVFATVSPDHEFPGAACFFQAKMEMGGIPALDVRQQCTGFVYGLSIADQFIRSGMYEKILVIGSEIHSRGLDISTKGRDLSVLFGDGCGAIVVEKTEVKDPKKDPYIMSSHLHADGKFAKELWTEGPGNGMGEPRVTAAMIEDDRIWPYMNGKAVFVNACKRMPQVTIEALNANGFTVDDVDLFLFHQANMRINEKCAEILKIPAEKVFNTIDRYANTTAATIPIGMFEAEKAGVLKPGMLVACVAFGSGFTWGANLLRW